MSDSDPVDAFVPTLRAAAATAKLLAEAGLAFAPTGDDLDAAASITRSVARDPGQLQTKAAVNTIFQQTPAALLMTEHILSEFGHKVVQEAEQVRNLVTNKLVNETENPDPRVRLRALELLGKTLGLFVDRVETEDKTPRDADAIRKEIEARIARLVG